MNRLTMKIKIIMKFLKMNTVNCMPLEQNPAFTLYRKKYSIIRLGKENKMNRLMMKKIKIIMKFLKMNTVKCMPLEQNPAFSTVCPRYISVMSLFAQFYLPSEQLAILLYLFFLPSPLMISVWRIIFHLLLKSARFQTVSHISWLTLISNLYSHISIWKKLCTLQLKII